MNVRVHGGTVTGDLTGCILQALAQTGSQGMSLPRLCKQVGVGASAAMRCLSALGTHPVGGVTGPGWTELTNDDGRWHVGLTVAGQRAFAALVVADDLDGADQSTGHLEKKPSNARQF